MTTLETKEVSHRWPDFLPDGNHFLYFAHGTTGITDSRESPLGGAFAGSGGAVERHAGLAIKAVERFRTLRWG
jgi:hypothetical protein